VLWPNLADDSWSIALKVAIVHRLKTIITTPMMMMMMMTMMMMTMMMMMMMMMMILNPN
jgi:hypothetical protein